MFSERRASDFMAARTSFSSLLIRLLPAARGDLFSTLRRNVLVVAATTHDPTSFVPVLYSPQRVTKYDHASPVPVSAIGRLIFSIFAFAPNARGTVTCTLACTLSKAATTAASACVSALLVTTYRSGTLHSQAPSSCLVINKNRVPFASVTLLKRKRELTITKQVSNVLKSLLKCECVLVPFLVAHAGRYRYKGAVIKREQWTAVTMFSKE